MRGPVLKVLLFLIVIGVGSCAAAWANPARADTAGALPDAGAITGPLFAPLAELPSEGLQPKPPALPQGPDLCAPAIAAASAGKRLPAGLLAAISVVESGRTDPASGLRRAWPWTIDANGTGYFYRSKEEAIAAAQNFIAAGVTSLDVGCMQINLQQHPDAFGSFAQAFDPSANARYAAEFLAGLQQKFGDWGQAVAAYHSQSDALGEPYREKVYAQWQGADPAQMAAAGQPSVFPVAPLAPSALQMSSLVPPMQLLSRPSGAQRGRSLASYRAAPVAIAGRPVPQG